jgi:hypothetical protein
MLSEPPDALMKPRRILAEPPRFLFGRRLILPAVFSRVNNIDVRVRRLLGVVTILFVAAVAFQINGSSIGVWKDALHDGASPAGILFSTPKSVRSDEWMSWTPSILSQALHRPAFPVENANLGGGKSPLLMSVPVRHFAMFFRPQLWGFFLFPIETGFAFYWNAKLCALFLSFFFLIRMLTRNNFWLAFFGAGWVCFSAYVQWWFSCPPMLPEMLASWATALLCAVELFRTNRVVSRMAITLLLVVAVVNFTLCFYPPFQIPLVYVGLGVFAGWLWQNRNSTLAWKPGAICLGIGVVGCAAVLVPYLAECKPTLEILAQTKYPGSRRSYGGELAITDVFNGVLGFFNNSERDFLATRGNSCEGSNFYPLWLFALAAGGADLWRGRRNRPIEIFLFAALALFALYAVCPFPVWLCRWTLLSYVTGTRALLAIGIAGILLTLMLLAQEAKRRKISRGFPAAVAACLGVALLFIASYPGNEKFLSVGRSSLLLGLNAGLIGLYFFAPRKVFCGVFLLALVLNNGGVNPIATGLGPLLKATATPAIQKIRDSDPEAKWIVYSTAWLPQFFKAQGVNVINGLQIVPDPALCHEVDPAGKNEMEWNRYAFAIFEPADPGEKPSFRPLGPAAYILRTSPGEPAFRGRNVRYAVFPRRLGSGEEDQMRLLVSFPENKIWIYKLPDFSMTSAAR